LKAASQALASASPSEARQGLLALAELSGDAPARVLAERLRAGLPPALLADAIDIAVQLGSPRAIPALTELLQHKRPALRKHAITALAALKAKTAQAALLAALDDPDREVRRAAIDALAELKVTRALPQLLALVARNQPGALQAVGKLAGARELTALLAQAPSGDVTPLKPALQIWLADERRAPAQQLELIAAMTRVASPSARAYLVEWLDAAKSAANPRVRTALFTAIRQLDQSDEVTRKTTRTMVQGVQVADETPGGAASSPQTKNKPANRKNGPAASAVPPVAKQGAAPTAAPASAQLARADAPKPAAETAVRADPVAGSPVAARGAQ
jgi:HEAT repeat protein